jgi:serine/threonine protein kinase/tetratricopeptide (TPR) repeat protein
MGLVYSAWDTRLQREVAIKLLREEFATPGMRQRFLQEARAASRLNHPNICTIFDMGEQEGDPYLVMELLKGETVRGRISRGPASSSDIVCVATEVADALAVAHNRGIIHRDIKPANIILVDKAQGRFQAKVLDFGLAKVERDGANTRFDLTSAGTTVGTVAYMSPEQARGESLDARSDLFSLGSVLYEMATGELPFQGATSALVFVQLLGQQPEPMRNFNPDISRDLEKVIATLLEKKRSERFQSAADVVEALGRVSAKKSSKGFWGSNKLAKSWAAIEPRPEKRTYPQTSPRANPATAPQTYPPTLPLRPPTREAVMDSILESRLHSKGSSAAETPPVPAAAPESYPQPQPGDNFLRPIKRIATDSSRPASGTRVHAAQPEVKAERPDVQPSAFSLFQAAHLAGSSSSVDRAVAPPATVPPAKVPPPKISPAKAPRVLAPAWSSSGTLSKPIEAAPASRPSDAAALPGIAADASAAVSSAALQNDAARARYPVEQGPQAEMSPVASPHSSASSETTVPSAAAAALQEAAASATALSSASAPTYSRLVTSRVPGRRFTAPEVRYEDEARPIEAPSSRLWVGGLLMLVVVILAVGAWYLWERKASPSGTGPSSLLLASVQDKTADDTLGSLFESGLLLDLRQSPHLSVRRSEDLQPGANAAGITLGGDSLSIRQARKIAVAAGDSLVALASIAQDGTGYTLTMRVYDAASGSKVEESTATATSREQISDAIDRLVSDARLGLGETADSIGSTNVPLGREASKNPDALQAFANAANLESAGKLSEAMEAYEGALKFDPSFTQAYLALAGIYRQQHADLEAANAATSAQARAVNASQRTRALAEASYALNRLGDPSQAVRTLTQLVAQYPADVEALLMLAAAQRASRNDVTALAAAQSALQIAPLSRQAHAEAELALIALDRGDEASQMEQQAQEAGQGHSAVAAIIGFLNLPTPSAVLPDPSDDELPAKLERADILDAEGQFTAGLAAWRDAIAKASSVPALSSTVSYALARAALNRALSGDCAASLKLLHESATMPRAAQASLNAGVADALCGDAISAKKELNSLAADSQNATAGSLYAPVVSAAIAWKAGDTPGALSRLSGTTEDQLWLAAYLSGLIHATAKSSPAALTDLQPLTVHRGSVAEEQPGLVALGEFQAALVFDSRNGPIHFRNFVNLWSNADPGSALLARAQAQIR